MWYYSLSRRNKYSTAVSPLETRQTPRANMLLAIFAFAEHSIATTLSSGDRCTCNKSELFVLIKTQQTYILRFHLPDIRQSVITNHLDSFKGVKFWLDCCLTLPCPFSASHQISTVPQWRQRYHRQHGGLQLLQHPAGSVFWAPTEEAMHWAVLVRNVREALRLLLEA